MTTIHCPHDKGYKYLLSSKKVFLELMQCFVIFGWVGEIDPESLIKVDKSYILQDFREKEADLVYRVRFKDREVIFYLLVEMQSTVDYLIPYRLLLYMVEILRDVMRNTNPELTERKEFRLPAVIPMVLYNGANDWTAPQSFRETLAGFEEFGDYLLDFRYILIDVNRCDKDTLLHHANLIGAVFLLDQKVGREEVISRLMQLMDVFKKLHPEEVNYFSSWFQQIVTLGMSKEEKNKVNQILEQSNPEEVEVMIYNLAETLKQSREDAVMEGEAKGRMEEKLEVAKKMIAKDQPEEFIAEMTGLEIEVIRDLKAGKKVVFY